VVSQASPFNAAEKTLTVVVDFGLTVERQSYGLNNEEGCGTSFGGVIPKIGPGGRDVRWNDASTWLKPVIRGQV